jgi:hypothetical protein
VYIKRLDTNHTIKASRVAEVLEKVKEKYPFIGTSLLDIFFPGSIRVKEPALSFWQRALEARFSENQYGTRLDKLPPLQVQVDNAST